MIAPELLKAQMPTVHQRIWRERMKYIITGTQLMILANVLDSQGIKHDLNELKPIEPLSEACAKGVAGLSNTSWAHSKTFVMSMVRAIERHILGETP